MDKEIDLGISGKERYENMGISQVAPLDAESKQYPRFRYSGPKDLDLPESGTMEIKFTKRSETSSVRSGGEHWYECEIEVRCICEVESEEEEEAEEGEGPGTEAEKALDTIARALGKERDEKDEGDADEKGEY